MPYMKRFPLYEGGYRITVDEEGAYICLWI